MMALLSILIMYEKARSSTSDGSCIGFVLSNINL